MYKKPSTTKNTKFHLLTQSFLFRVFRSLTVPVQNVPHNSARIHRTINKKCPTAVPVFALTLTVENREKLMHNSVQKNPSTTKNKTSFSDTNIFGIACKITTSHPKLFASPQFRGEIPMFFSCKMYYFVLVNSVRTG